LVRILASESERVRPDGGHPAGGQKALENAVFCTALYGKMYGCNQSLECIASIPRSPDILAARSRSALHASPRHVGRRLFADGVPVFCWRIHFRLLRRFMSCFFGLRGLMILPP
jgi:hypothetical protein